MNFSIINFCFICFEKPMCVIKTIKIVDKCGDCFTNEMITGKNKVPAKKMSCTHFLTFSPTSNFP